MAEVLPHRRILVSGASSQLGRALLQERAGRGDHFTCISRQPGPKTDAGVEWLQADLDAGWPDVSGDALLSFGPLQALADGLASLHVAPFPRVVATSSMSAESKRDALLPEDRALSEGLRNAEAALIAQCERLGIGWTILRPTMIYGMGIDENLTPIARRAMRTRLFPYPLGRGLRQPVHAADVAEAAWRAIHLDAAIGKTIEVGGGERIRIDQMFRRVRASLPSSTLPLPVPRPLSRVAARLLPGLRGAISRLDRDLIADNGDLEDLLGVHPRAFSPIHRTWQAGGA